MNLSTNGIRNYAGRLSAFLKSYGLVLIIALLFSVFGIFGLQKYFDRLAADSQDERNRIYNIELQKSQEEKNRLLDLFNRQHESTVEILGSLKLMNDSIGKIMENDRRQDAVVGNLQEEYQNVRNPNSPDKKTTAVLTRRRALPLRQREDDVLARDAKLYGTANK